MKHPSSRVLAGAASVVLILAVGACGGDDDDDSSATTTVAAAAPATTDAETATTAGAATTAPADDGMYGTPSAGTSADAAGGSISIADSSLGPILVDAEGMTLYMFVPDNSGPSVCTEDCLAAWPALYAPVTAGDGVDDALIGTAVRPDDGKEQATYGGWPLYTFVQDAAPGDVNGQDANEKWYVMGADGQPIKDAS